MKSKIRSGWSTFPIAPIGQYETVCQTITARLARWHVFVMPACKINSMKIVIKILFLAAICIAASATQALAQKKRADKTSSAKAYYGQTPAKPKYKAKKNKMSKTFRSQSMKRTRAEARNRKKYS
ncbi:MAG TPA: hypothetical protein VGD65_00045 [Chryseosolibacter sp.]